MVDLLLIFFMKKKNIEDKLIFSFALDTTKGMIHLHEEGVIHRDLAARNLLLTKDLNVKISDFGYARVLDNQEEGKTVSNVGPLKWMAPECIQKQVYSTKTDVFAFSIALIEMFTCGPPYGEETSVNVAIKVAGGGRPDLPQGRSTFWSDLLQRCWHQDPEKRPKFTEIYDDLKQHEKKSPYENF